MTDSNKSCQVSLCPKDRAYETYYCRNHLQAVQSHGHPLAKALSRASYSKELEEVTAILDNNPTHKGILRALAAIDRWLVEASDYVEFIGRSEASRLLDQKITSREILIECVAVWAYSVRHPELYLSDDALTYQITNAMLRLAPRPLVISSVTGKEYRKRVSVTAIRAIGFHIRSLLNPFFEIITFGTHQQPQPKRNPLRKLKDAFSNIWFWRFSNV